MLMWTPRVAALSIHRRRARLSVPPMMACATQPVPRLAGVAIIETGAGSG